MVAFYIKAFLQNTHSFTVHLFIHFFTDTMCPSNIYGASTRGIQALLGAWNALFILPQCMSRCPVYCEVLNRCEEIEYLQRTGLTNIEAGPQLFGLLALVNFRLFESLLPHGYLYFPPII